MEEYKLARKLFDAFSDVYDLLDMQEKTKLDEDFGIDSGTDFAKFTLCQFELDGAV